ncbi:MAG: phosphoribosyltransferase [Alphaproteobacteria bacterium]
MRDAYRRFDCPPVPSADMIPKPPRTAWIAGFPDVVIHTALEARDTHADYWDAKAGDGEAAMRLVEALITLEAIDRIRTIVDGHNPIIVPASAIEKFGFNAIPDAMALELGRRLDLEVDAEGINQINIVSHTRANGFHRLATPAAFDGPVVEGRSYFLVDDHVGLGGTLANLKGHIEVNGGRVVGATCLTESVGSHVLALTETTLEALRRQHGKELEEFWVEEVGHALECLTEAEGGYLRRSATLDRIRNQMAKAATRHGGGRLPEEA